MKRFENGVNAGSMADVAFLLLIFFLVATTIDVDKGITVKLPPWAPDQEPTEAASNNVLAVKVNKFDDLMIRGERTHISKLKGKTIEFILNPQQQTNMPDSPKKAVISLQNDRETSYQAYIAVYNELKAAYNSIWKEEALKRYGEVYEHLPKSKKQAIRSDIPLVISEAEPI